MFVDNLTYIQRKNIAKKVCEYFGKSVYRYSVNGWCYLEKEPYLEIFVYDYERGNYPIAVFDTYVYMPYARDLKEVSNICAKELYKIFGEEYKEHYMQQVNSIFE